MLIAIYSRKSKWTGRGESVENQITMCREYIVFNIARSKEAKIIVYEDEGFSGKDTNRPQFQKMMTDMKREHYDYLVCYKLDRLGRNIADLALLIEELNKQETNFISIKEKFDTSTPIGKAMLYFSGVLAQMEREQIAERVRDNMIMLARDGRWLGGTTPLGYEATEEKKVTIDGRKKSTYRLIPKKSEIELVQFMFQEYLARQSLTKVVEYLLKHNITSRKNKEYTITTVRDILTNPVYCVADQQAYVYFFMRGCQICFDKEEADGSAGLTSYAKTSSNKYKNQDNPPEKWMIAIGSHKGIICGKDFIRVQNLLESNRQKGTSFHRVQNEISLLSGSLYCSCGHRMRPKYYSKKDTTNEKERKFSYLCPYKDQTHGEKCRVCNVSGNALDKLVCAEILSYTKKHIDIIQIEKELIDRIKQGETEIITSEVILKRQIQEQHTKINNLLEALAKSNNSEEFVRQIERKIEKLNQSCIFMERELKEQESTSKQFFEEGTQLDYLVKELSSVSNFFDTLTVAEKREYLRMILDEIIWDGVNAHIFICGSH